MTQTPARTPPRTCGHEGYSRTQIDVRRLSEASPDNHVIRFISLTGGGLNPHRPSNVSATTSPTNCDNAGKNAETIGDDTEVVTAALTAVVAQPEVDIFTLTISASKERSLVVPRHHLPVFIIERR